MSFIGASLFQTCSISRETDDGTVVDGQPNKTLGVVSGMSAQPCRVETQKAKELEVGGRMRIITKMIFLGPTADVQNGDQITVGGVKHRAVIAPGMNGMAAIDHYEVDVLELDDANIGEH